MIFYSFNAVVRRNEPTRHQHSRVDAAYGSHSPNRDGYRSAPSQSGYIPDRGFQTPGHENEQPSYPAPSGSFNAAVGFSVKHIMELKKDSQHKPY